MATVTMQISSPTIVQTIPQPPTPSTLSLSAGVPSSSSAPGAPKVSSDQHQPSCYLPFDELSRVHLEEKKFRPSPELPNVATSIRKPNIDWTLEDVPKSSATVQEAVRHDYMRRLISDTSTREERVNAILQPNLQKANLVNAKSSSLAGDALVAELMASKEDPWTLNPGLHDVFVNKFQLSEATLKTKAVQLQKTYLELDRWWSVHCQNLDAEIAAQPPEPEPTPPPKTQVRATRRGLVAVQNGEAILADPLSLNNTPQPPEIHDPEATIKRADRNAAKIPDMFSVSDLDRARLQYDDTNLDVTEHTEEFFALRTGIFDWTEEERTIFFETYIRHPKVFWRIADELPNKTVAQCVAYYYLHKKHLIDFRHGQGKKRKGGRRPKTRRAGGLLADIVQHDADMAGPATRSRTGTAPPDSKRTYGRRGIPTPVTSQANTPEPEGRPKRKRTTQPSSRTREYDMFEDSDDDEPPARKAGRKPKKRQYKSAAIVEDEDEPMPLAAPVPQQAAALKPSSLAVLVDVALAGLAAAAATPAQAPSSPQVASMPATPPEPSPILQHQHKFKLSDLDDQAAAARKRALPGHMVWGDSDKELFLRLVAQYGDDYKRIASSMPNKTTLQVRSYFTTHAVELNLNELVVNAPKRSPSPGQEQASSSTASTPFANSSAQMSVLNFSKTVAQAVPGSYYKSRETHQPRDLVPNTFMLDKNGDVRFSVKEHMQMGGSSTSSSSKVAPAMDSLNNDGGSAASRASSSPQLPVLQTTFSALTSAQAWPRFQGSTPGPSTGATTLPPFSFSTSSTSKASSSRSSSSSTITPAAEAPTTPSAPPGQMLQSLPAGFMNSLHQVQPYPLFAATNIQAYGQPTQFPNPPPPHHPHPSHHSPINPYGYGPFQAYQLYPLAAPQRQFLSATATAGGDASGQAGGPVGRPGLGFYFSSSPSSSSS